MVLFSLSAIKSTHYSLGVTKPRFDKCIPSEVELLCIRRLGGRGVAAIMGTGTSYLWSVSCCGHDVRAPGDCASAWKEIGVALVGNARTNYRAMKSPNRSEGVVEKPIGTLTGCHQRMEVCPRRAWFCGRSSHEGSRNPKGYWLSLFWSIEFISCLFTGL